MASAKVGVIMGSKSDWPVMEAAVEVLKAFGVEAEVEVVSAHRTPERMAEFASTAADRGLKVIIAGAGGAAHLPGMTASQTILPVIGVPVKTTAMSGIDSLYSIVQMPKGVPVASVAIDNATNAALLAIQILATSDPKLAEMLLAHREKMKAEVQSMNSDLHT